MDLLLFILIVLYVVCSFLNEGRPANKPPTSCPKEPPHIEKRKDLQMLNKFNQKFGVSGSFKMIELENAIVEKFGSIQYFRYEHTPNSTFDPTWDCGTDFEWEYNRLHSECFLCHSREEALMNLCIEHPHEFEDIVKKVYKILKVVK